MNPTPAKRRLLNARFRRRLLAHHIALLVVATDLTFAFYFVTPSAASHFRLSLATAYAALIFLAVTLIIGPLNLLLKLRNPVSGDLRRDIGIWAAFLSLLHVLVSLPIPAVNVLFFFADQTGVQGDLTPRLDLFGLANYVGLLATALALFLLLLANDWSLTLLGARRWKRYQRWTYPLFILVLLHGLGYILLQHRSPPLLATFILVPVVAIVLQLAGFLIKRRRLQARRPLSDPTHGIIKVEHLTEHPTKTPPA
jgi:sulfoxide reductase heme-binding subunit YedZ